MTTGFGSSNSPTLLIFAFKGDQTYKSKWSLVLDLPIRTHASLPHRGYTICCSHAPIATAEYHWSVIKICFPRYFKYPLLNMASFLKSYPLSKPFYEVAVWSIPEVTLEFSLIFSTTKGLLKK
jgi:hypothetical protein